MINAIKSLIGWKSYEQKSIINLINFLRWKEILWVKFLEEIFSHNLDLFKCNLRVKRHYH